MGQNATVKEYTRICDTVEKIYEVIDYPCPRHRDNYKESSTSCPITKASNKFHFHSYLFFSHGLSRSMPHKSCMDHRRSDAGFTFTLTHVKQQCRKSHFVFEMTAFVSKSVNPVQHRLVNYNRIPILSNLLSYSVHSVRFESNGGNPHAAGSNSSREFSTK